tara:strand:+ start:449 stop:1036 length:588 start_codon:yes stop_codon:yes gene_type:complete
MIPKLIYLGVETILKIICEKIIIKRIKMVHKDKKFNGKIDELYIMAESIIFNKINISNINIKLRDIILRLAFNKKEFFIENCCALIQIRLTSDNIYNTLINNEWNKLKESIESFICTSFESIQINNNSINFISSDTFSKNNISYSLQYDENTISLVNNINEEKLSILNDKNIIVRNLFLSQNYIELELSSSIIFN